MLDPGIDQRNYSIHYQHWPVSDLAVFHPHPAQTWYFGFATSSWPIPVRGIHHDKGVRYCVLYSVHTGVPVQRKNVSHINLVTRVAAQIRRWSYQVACHMLVRNQIELASAKH